MNEKSDAVTQPALTLAVDELAALRRLGAGARLQRSLRRNLTVVFAALLLLGIIAGALLAPLLAPHPPLRQNILKRLLPPAWEAKGERAYPLGTDQLGRDVLSRILWGGRISLLVGFSAVLIACSLGSVAGLLSGFFGGRIDTVLMRLADVFFAIPFILLAMAVVAVLGQELTNLILVLGVARWGVYARITRGQVLGVRSREFVESARALGASTWRILFRHVWPNTTSPIIVIATLEIANMIIYESALGFLGLGVRPPEPTWGNMLADGRDSIMVAWWVTTFPGLAILLTVLSINLLGDWLRDLLDPRLRVQL